MTGRLIDEPSPPRPDWVGDTYKYVRLITPFPAIWLLLSIVAVFLVRQQVLDSISDYYGGPLRDVFVGALAASAVGMIAYKGHSRLEDYALNFAGLNAFFVALVPNSFQDLLNDTKEREHKGVAVPVSSADLTENLRIGVGVLLAVVLVFVLLDALVMHWTRFRADEQTRLTNGLLGLSLVFEIVLLVGILAMVAGLTAIRSAPIFSLVHFAAATLLIINLSFAAASHAFPGRLRNAEDGAAAPPRVQRWFKVITVSMWIGLVLGTWLIVGGAPKAILMVEVVEIVLFLVFWFLATRSEWPGLRKIADVGTAPSQGAAR